MTTNTKAQHTAGEWTVSEFNHCTIVSRPESQTIALLCVNDDLEANRRLICSAPDLLAACEALLAHGVTHAVGCSHLDTTCSCHRNTAKTAIAKARGSQP